MLDADVTILYLFNRYACLVCKHRPTFDTIAMLSVHRSGQKHIRGMNATCTHIYVYLYICSSTIEGKIYSRTDIISDPRLQRSKNGSNCARSSEQQDMLALG